MHRARGEQDLTRPSGFVFGLHQRRRDGRWTRRHVMGGEQRRHYMYLQAPPSQVQVHARVWLRTQHFTTARDGRSHSGVAPTYDYTASQRDCLASGLRLRHHDRDSDPGPQRCCTTRRRRCATLFAAIHNRLRAWTHQMTMPLCALVRLAPGC